MSTDKMDPVKRSTHVRVEEDLLDNARKEAEERGITFSTLYRRALEAELEYPGLITEVRDLRRDVEVLARAVEGTQGDVKRNFKIIKETFELLKEHEELFHR